jgi:hypothetical protein
MYRLLCARMVLASEFVVGTGCIGAVKRGATMTRSANERAHQPH